MIAATPHTALSAKPVRLALLGAAVLFLAGCASFNETYVYLPRPVQVTTTIHGVPAAPTPPAAPGAAPAPGVAAVPGEGWVRALVSVIGLNEINGKAQEPPAIKVRMRLWNQTNGPVTVNPGPLVLVAADTSLFPAPTVEPAAPFDLAPGQSGEVTALFPVPGGKVANNGHDLTALTLQWSVQVAGRTVPQSALFQRYRRVPYYGPYYYNDPWWPGYGPGYVWY